MHHVVTIACPGTALFDVGIPSRVFGAARTADDEPAYDVTIASPTGAGPLLTKDGVSVDLPGVDQIKETDTVVVASSDALLDPLVRRDMASALAPFLLQGQAVRPGVRVAAVCSGAFLLGELGLLDHRTATTHWRLADQLAKLFPSTHLQTESLYIEDDGVLTSGGVAAGIDLCLHMIRQDYGVRIANDVARSCVVAPFREGGQAQYVQTPVPRSADPSMNDLVHWLLETLDQRHTLEDIAHRGHMSTRTFERRFRREHGTSPGQWLTTARIQRAKELLESTDLPVERIAELVGLGTASNLRTHFTRCVGRTPQAYRRSFTAGSNSTNVSGQYT